MGGGNKVTSSTSSLWLAQNPSKRWGEVFFLLYTPFWLTLCLGVVVPYKLYEDLQSGNTSWWGLFPTAVPALIVPMIFVGKADRNIAWKDGLLGKIQFPYDTWTKADYVWKKNLLEKKINRSEENDKKSVLAPKIWLQWSMQWVKNHEANLWIAIFTYVGSTFLDPLFLHSSGGFLYISILEDE
ncbi:Bifunctional protein GlmU [Datura stramonium]|uniref:Bifunctional protein GlmU n=1 Tax=Datura stramonium TaxID=4076 RepID=A0ABS8V419_DATST|nr:Bifunctional protein GlmU [Datura stramonium]